MGVYNNRFERNRTFPWMRALWLLPVAIFAALFILFYSGVLSVSDTTAAKQREGLENALNRSIIQCYAVEGVYPPSLDYLKDHYGLTYDESRFFVDYQPIGGNLKPDVTIIERTGDAQ